MRRPYTLVLAASALAAALAACGDSPSGGNDPLPDNAATAVGLTVRDNVEASFDAFFPPRLLQPLSTGPAEDPCVTPSSATNTDGDGVPDDATYNFTAPPCRYTGVRGFTLGVVGQLRLEDPDAGTAGLAANYSLTNLRFDLTAEDPDNSYSLTRNGTMVLSGTIAGLELVTDLQVRRSFTGLQDAFVEQQWELGFTPESNLAINQPLPSGAVTVAGFVGWSRGDSEAFDLTITTATPLHYNATCDAVGQRFDEGELHVTGTFGEVPGYVRITWTDCGDDPGIEFVEE